jgi:hypothetical protein
MLLKFAGDFREYSEGMSMPLLKENEPFEVSQTEGERLLAITGKRLEGKGKDRKFSSVPVFEVFEAKITSSTLPEGFPYRKELEENKVFTFEQVASLDRKGLLDLDNIGEVKADAIMAEVEKMKSEKGE